MGQSTLLRTLTEKSFLGFGQYAELRVQQVIDLKHKDYLAWAYHNLSNITFTEELLNLMGVTEEFRIQKPGKDKEVSDKFKEYKKGITSEFMKFKNKKKSERITKAIKVRERNFENVRFSKANLARINHGHK